jgi:hypothetical protein
MYLLTPIALGSWWAVLVFYLICSDLGVADLQRREGAVEGLAWLL